MLKGESSFVRHGDCVSYRHHSKNYYLSKFIYGYPRKTLERQRTISRTEVLKGHI